MIKGLLGFVLALSALFNVFFAAGYAKARANAFEKPVAETLLLSADQQLQYQELQRDAEQKRAEIDRGIATSLDTLQTEILATELNPERVRTALSNLYELREERREVGRPYFEEFLGMLQPDQRKRLHRELSRHSRYRQQMLEKYDTNRNGDLDDTERAAARGDQDRRRAEHAKRLEQTFSDLFSRADADGDDKLDRAELRQFVQQMQQRMRGGGNGAPDRRRMGERRGSRPGERNNERGGNRGNDRRRNNSSP